MKAQKIISFVIILVGIIGLGLWSMMNSGISELMDSAGISDTKDLVKYPEENPELFNAATGEVSPLYTLLIVVGVVLLVVTLISIVNSLAKNPKGIKKVIVNVVAFLVLAAICYFAFASGVETPMKDGEVLSANGSKLVGTGLYLFYFLLTIALGLMIFSGVKKTIK